MSSLSRSFTSRSWFLSFSHPFLWYSIVINIYSMYLRPVPPIVLFLSYQIHTWSLFIQKTIHQLSSGFYYVTYLVVTPRSSGKGRQKLKSVHSLPCWMKQKTSLPQRCRRERNTFLWKVLYYIKVTVVSRVVEFTDMKTSKVHSTRISKSFEGDPFLERDKVTYSKRLVKKTDTFCNP